MPQTMFVADDSRSSRASLLLPGPIPGPLGLGMFIPPGEDQSRDWRGLLGAEWRRGRDILGQGEWEVDWGWEGWDQRSISGLKQLSEGLILCSPVLKSVQAK